MRVFALLFSYYKNRFYYFVRFVAIFGLLSPFPAMADLNKNTTSFSESDTVAVASGAWHSKKTWSNGVPNRRKRAVIPSGLTVVLTRHHHRAKELVIQGRLKVREQGRRHKTMAVDWVHVNSGGVFQVGKAHNRFDRGTFTLTLKGRDPKAVFHIPGVPMPVTDNNGFLMVASGGRLQFFGDDKQSYTKLHETAEAGASTIRVVGELDRNYDGVINDQDGKLNWRQGDRIVIASSTNNYRDEEVRTISAIVLDSDGSYLIHLDLPLLKRHYGEIETYRNDTRTWEIDMRAEVALLSRNIRIRGLAGEDTDNKFGDRARFVSGEADGFGAHTMIMNGAGQITIDNVQFDRMGQTARLGRYPIHWHLAGNREGDLLRSASITNSNNRGVTIHGTHNLLIENVVLHDIHGHGFFMEDGVETGNQFIANIAFGIHKVGRSADVGNFAPDLNDPFIVDTHDHVGQNGNRFLSSAAYWMTNPDNTWVGNISAGSEGTGFWFIFPNFPIGVSANDPQYTGVSANFTNLRQFDHNSTHSSPVGLNFDRGQDIEVPVGAELDEFFLGRQYLPSEEPQINRYTAYQHYVGIYHRGIKANFHENRFADTFNTTFITFTQRITDSLYIGHSRGNSNPSATVTGHSIYDGANILDGNHFAGYAADNAHMFRGHSSARRHTHHLFSNTSFEDDGSAFNLSIATQEGTAEHTMAFGYSASALYDVDGTLTGHVGGGAGKTVVTNHPFFYDEFDIKPEGWNAWISDNLYGMLTFEQPFSRVAFKVATPDGDSDQISTVDGIINTVVKMDAGAQTVEIPGGVSEVAAGFDFLFYVRVGPNWGSTALRLVDMAPILRPQGVPLLADFGELGASSSTAYIVVGNDIWMKVFPSANKILMRPF